MSKKIIMILITAALLFWRAVNVDAATLSSDGESADVMVKYTVNNTAYEITIPAVICPSTSESSFSVSSEYMNLRPDEYIQVSLSSGCEAEGIVTLKRQNVPKGKPVSEIDTVLSINGVTLDKLSNIVGRFEDGADSTRNLVDNVSVGKLNIDRTTEAGDYMAIVEFRVDLKSKV